MASSKKARLLYSVRHKQAHNSKKIQMLQKDFVKLIERMKKEGKTKWIVNAMGYALARLKKAGFSEKTIEGRFDVKISEVKVEKKAKAAPKKTAAKAEPKKEAEKKPATKAATPKKPAAKKAPAAAKAK